MTRATEYWVFVKYDFDCKGTNTKDGWKARGFMKRNVREEMEINATNMRLKHFYVWTQLESITVKKKNSVVDGMAPFSGDGKH